MDKYVGKRLDGRYDIQEVIGVGGMAVVYKAYDRVDDRVVSIKILKDEYIGNDEFMRRFRNESRAIAILSHPNIVKVYDVSFGDRLQYIVMEYIDGITLKEYISQQKLIDWKEAVYFTQQILRALQHAHEKGVIHRDIKPQNIMLLSDGTIKVTDFGIARFSRSESRTITDKAIGSVHYIAPEQARGGVTDEKSDIYSVGVMLYEMLTGKLPFEAENAVSVAIMQMQSEPRNPKDINPLIPEGLEEITMKAMKKDPAQRYASAAEMLRDINEFKQNPSIKFQYKYFIDEKPTKYVDAIDHVRGEEPVSEPVYVEPPYEPEEPESRREKVRAVPIITGVAIALVLFALVFGTILFLRNLPSDQKEEVFLPDFVGQNIEAVQEQYKDQFTFVVLYDDDAEVPYGQIKRQEPKGGYKDVVKGSEVTLTVSNGAKMTTVPQGMNGMQLSQAVTMLTSSGLRHTTEEVYSEDTAAGCIVESSPKGGTQIPEQATVTLYVSKGPEEKTVVMPKLEGMPFEDAKDEILRRNLKVADPISVDSDRPKGEVVKQEPAYGDTVSEGDTVQLTISNGTPPAPVSNEVTIPVTLPTTAQGDLRVTVLVNGVLVENQTKTVRPSLTKEVPVTLSGTEESVEVVICLDGKNYQWWHVNFVEKKATLTKDEGYQPSNRN